MTRPGPNGTCCRPRASTTHARTGPRTQPDHTAILEDGLYVHGLPDRPAFDVLQLQSQADLLRSAPKRTGSTWITVSQAFGCPSPAGHERNARTTAQPLTVMIEDFPPRLNSLGQDFQLAQPDGANVAHPVIVTNGRVLVVVLHRGPGCSGGGPHR